MTSVDPGATRDLWDRISKPIGLDVMPSESLTVAEFWRRVANFALAAWMLAVPVAAAMLRESLVETAQREARIEATLQTYIQQDQKSSDALAAMMDRRLSLLEDRQARITQRVESLEGIEARDHGGLLPHGSRDKQ